MNQTFWEQMTSVENRMEAMVRSLGLWTPGRERLGPLPARPFAPAMDMIGRNGSVVLRLDLPGIDAAKDLTVTVGGGELTIHGERHEMADVKDEDYYRVETFKGTFERHLPLPEGTPADKITAQYADGILEIVIPAPAKPAVEPKAKRIPVRTAIPAKT